MQITVLVTIARFGQNKTLFYSLKTLYKIKMAGGGGGIPAAIEK